MQTRSKPGIDGESLPGRQHAVRSSAATDGVRSDVVVFANREDRLCVLLAPLACGEWTLPGACLSADEDVDDCARRVVHDQARLDGIYLEQLRTFGRPDRDPRARIVTVAYLALCGADRALAHADTGNGDTNDSGRDRYEHALPDAATPRWHDVDTLGSLALTLDHLEIVCCARERLMAKLHYSTIGLALMPELFTLSELQSTFETVLGTDLDKRNFRRRMLALDCLQATRRMRREGSHRPARLYRCTCRGSVQFLR